MKKIVSFLFIILVATASTVDAKNKPRKFYLTLGVFDGSQALTACADGYHMASLYEIFDVSTLRYDKTLGATQDDSGFGPPAGAVGWIRTGTSSFGTIGVPGVDNCFAWTSNSLGDFGSVVSLLNNWSIQLWTPISPWSGASTNCAGPRHVWCVQDLKGK
jgi:hypothetical protein